MPPNRKTAELPKSMAAMSRLPRVCVGSTCRFPCSCRWLPPRSHLGDGWIDAAPCSPGATRRRWSRPLPATGRERDFLEGSEWVEEVGNGWRRGNWTPKKMGAAQWWANFWFCRLNKTFLWPTGAGMTTAENLGVNTRLGDGIYRLFCLVISKLSA